MPKNHPNMGIAGRPFPKAGKSQALRDEDAFMQEHGSKGARFVFCFVNSVPTAIHFAHGLRCQTGLFIASVTEFFRSVAKQKPY